MTGRQKRGEATKAYNRRHSSDAGGISGCSIVHDVQPCTLYLETIAHPQSDAVPCTLGLALKQTDPEIRCPRVGRGMLCGVVRP